MTSLKIYISPVMKKLEIWTQLNLIERVTLGTLPHEVETSLAYNHMTNLLISSYRGATVIKIEQLKQLLYRSS